ncbi:hypothetical protein [Massilia genomosp. 1]|uniref:hypothetical protein n=1 Tax=Massilia genomosp. 1 TaxID=2609280 RepID=UPI0014210577|nr:hypothetical protein [Massilia genomosp. 1]
MKHLCLTGAAQSDLDKLAVLLRGAGLAPAAGAASDAAITIDYWHEQVLASADAARTPVTPGPPWEGLAKDIILANAPFPAWGWAHAGSVLVAEFWLRLDPDLCFVLVSSSLEHVMSHVLASAVPSMPLATIIARWQCGQRRLLSLHSRHPHRCLLVDASDCLDHGAAFVARCIDQWKLPLHLGQAAIPHPVRSDGLARLLAQQILGQQGEMAELQHRLASAASRFGNGRSPGIVADPREHAIADFQEHARLFAHHEQYASECEQALRTTNGRLQEALMALGDAEQNAYRLRETVLENELMNAQIARIAENMGYLAVRNERIEHKWRGFLDSTPGYVHYDTLELLVQGNGRTRWRITELESAGLAIPVMEFDTLVIGSLAGIVLTRAGAADAPLSRWPLAAGAGEELLLTADAIPDAAGPDVVADIGTRDWRMLRALASLLAQLTAAPQQHGFLPAFPAQALHAGMCRLSNMLENYAHVLRVDRLHLKREQINADYEHLWLRADTLSFMADAWPEWEFRLACAEVGPECFGTHPKLEFLAGGTPAVLEHWFAESADAAEDRMELRFALPDAVDLGMWQKLSARDQALLCSLIERLPDWLATLERDGALLRRPWSDWTALARHIASIAAERLPGAAAALRLPLP